MSRLMRGPLGFLAGWAERGLLAIGVLLRLFQSSGLKFAIWRVYAAYTRETAQMS